MISTSEYIFSIPGVLKNALDRASRPVASSPLGGKPVGMMGASPGGFGTVRAQMHLRQMCVFANMLPLNKPEVLISRAGDKFDSAGHLTDDHTRKAIRSLLEALAAWTHRLGGR